MKPELIPTRDIVAAIDSAYDSSSVCHCQTDGKLSKDELMRLLVVREIIPLSFFNGVDAVTIREAFHAHEWGRQRSCVYELAKRLHFVTELTEWTFADLLTLPQVGRGSAREVERIMATYGLLLKDGDPALLAKTEEGDSDDAVGTLLSATGGTPEEITNACAKALLKIGNEVIRDGVSLLKFSGEVAFGDSKQTPSYLKRYIHKRKQSQYEEVRRVVASWLALLEANRARGKGAAKRQPTNRPAVEAEDNVVRAAFGQGG